MKKFDSFDLRLTKLLQVNARATTTWLAKKLGCSRRKVSIRMRNLEKEGVLVSYNTGLNLRMARWGFNAMTSVKVNPVMIRSVIREVLKFKNVYAIYHITGEYDLEIFGWFANRKEFEQFVVDRLPTVNGIERLSSRLFLKTYYFGKEVVGLSARQKKAKTRKKLLDETDLKIAKLLYLNGRASARYIAKKLGISSQTVINRMKNLEKIGVISSYWTAINAPKIGLGMQASIHIFIDPPYFKQVLDKIRKLKPLWIDETTGEEDLLLYVDFKDEEEMRTFIRDKIGQIEGIRKIGTYFIIKFYHKPTLHMGN